MANSFCKYLSNGLRVQSDWGKLMVNPCCLVPTPMVYLTDPLFDQKMNNFHTASACHGCQSENYHMRDRATIDIDGAPENGVISFLELSIDIDCNAACLSCGDFFSSTWVAQNKKFKIKTVDDYPDPQDPDNVVNQLFETFDLSQLQKVSFMGGEPFRAKTTELFLNRLTESYPTSNIKLLFTTNASIRPTPDLISLIAKFKSVSVIFSLDGVDKRFEYLRYPLSWDKVCDTIAYFKTLNILEFGITYTINPFNIYYCDEILNWSDKFFKNDPQFFKVGFVPASGTLGLGPLPLEYKQVLLEKYSTHPRLHKMLTTLPTNNVNYQNLLTYINQMDNFRNLSWKDTFPEIVHFFN